MTAGSGSASGSGGGRWVLWLPGLVVALGAAAATAHGLYEVAVAARVPTSIAWIYPLITDGLAVVAYTATARLSGSARGYAWAVVVLSAGLSGLAQAVFLASDPNPAVPVGLAVPGALRFGIGAWPAIAAALAAHLLHLLAADHHAADHPAADHPAADHPAADHAAVDDQRSAVQAEPDRSTGSVQPDPFNGSERSNQRSTGRAEVSTGPFPIVESGRLSGPPFNVADGVVTPFIGRIERLQSRGQESPARDRALAAAARLTARIGALPTVSELETEAGVSRGTAAAVLKALRAAAPAGRALGATSPGSHNRDFDGSNDDSEDTQP